MDQDVIGKWNEKTGKIDFEEAGFGSMMMSGLDTNSMNTFLELKHSSACTATTYNTYVFHDLIIEIDFEHVFINE